ncbi:MAG: DUF2723 domain-containing protein [Ignavibacteriales bacterium]|nr:DUF2723 domain-containing protein [Ignavibacteriales bacterium]
MNHYKINRIVAFAIFVVSLLTYLRTIPPTVVFWDVGEHCAASIGVQVQHPPGSPLLVLVMRVASMIPVVADLALRMILVNLLASCIVVVLLYLITVRVILMWRSLPSTPFEALSLYGSAAIGALALTFSTTFWFNSIEVETRNVSLLFTALIIWLVLLWYEKAYDEHSDLYLLLITFLVGLTVGVHIHGLLGFFVAILLVYFRFYKKSLREFLFSTDVFKFGVVASLIFWTAYPGIVKWFPSMLDADVFGYKSQIWIAVAIGILLGAMYLVRYSTRKNNRILNIASLAFLFIVLGYSTYLVTFMRANANTPMNENDPSNLKRLVSYLERDQYGETPLMNRRFSLEPDKMENFKKYTSDLDYFWEYQIKHMYLRYMGWNFIGKEADWQDAGVRFSQLYGIPFLIGILGLVYHWRKNQKIAFVMSVFFLLTGFFLAFYFNMQEQQPRERDYFFVYSVFSFCLWIGIGVSAVFEFLRERLTEKNLNIVAFSTFAIALILVPGNMLRTNYHPMSRNGHYLAWDYSYNLLQSVEKDAILITAGDNDTFPLWYLQDAEGIRRDVRIVNLSLANTDWYIKQLKHSEPYGAKTVPVSIPDDQIEGIQPMMYKTQTVQIPIPRFATEGWNSPDNVDANSTAIIDTMRFVMPATLQYGNVSALRVQDILVFDILRTSNWRRPIYFAITTGGEANNIGLREYLELQGLAFKVVPARKQAYWSAVHEERTKAHLFTDVPVPSKGPAYGCLWRGLSDSTIHFDENQRRMISSYRQPFFNLATYLANIKNKPNEVLQVLNRMEQVVPRRIHSMDYRLKSDLASFYTMAGDTKQHREILGEIVAELAPGLDTAPLEQLSQYNPLVILLQTYEGLGNFEKGLEVLQRIERSYGTSTGVKEFVSAKKMELEMMRRSQNSVVDSAVQKTPGKK